MRNCIDCQKEIKNKKALRCRPCHGNLCRGVKRPQYIGEKISKSKLGTIVSVETRAKMSLSQKGIKHIRTKHKIINYCIDCKTQTKNKYATRCRRCFGIFERGENHPNWQPDRSKVSMRDKVKTYNPYKKWREDVLGRDNHVCKMFNKDCKGRLEIHHILNWKDYPELRYDINNGITLCHFHHPIGRVKESNMSPYFQEIIKTQND